MINERDEIFEAKVFHDSRWPWPRGDVQRDVAAAARRCLEPPPV